MTFDIISYEIGAVAGLIGGIIIGYKYCKWKYKLGGQ